MSHRPGVLVDLEVAQLGDEDADDEVAVGEFGKAREPL
jgi:hypothetical protein